ncbi:MAG: HNH endonuclease, partial [Desulfovibrio sp.]|nr:HNH endonuclease [Desulfovibrio sp.]
PSGKSVVHHKDGVADNNVADNLEWCTLSECVAREEIQKRRVATRRKKGPWDNRAKPVEIVTEGGNVVARFLNAKIAERLGAVCAETIRNQCRGRRSRTPGFQWRYVENLETKEG